MQLQHDHTHIGIHTTKYLTFRSIIFDVRNLKYLGYFTNKLLCLRDHILADAGNLVSRRCRFRIM